MPASLSRLVYREGLPAAVTATLTFSSMTTAIKSSIPGVNSGKLTPKGFEVRLLAVLICCLKWATWSSLRLIPAVGLIRPKPPALETAAANSALVIHTMPPWIIGYSIPSKSQSRVFFTV
ncbi:hypothetical protein ES703_125489 [subsurface metagenome]